MAEKNCLCVYCGSSPACDASYHDAARQLGVVLAENGYSVVYGGGALGSMGALAEGVLAAGGEIVGVIPEFMVELEWGHTGLQELLVVNDMRERKQAMLARSHGVIALPGGSGTFEELFEALTLKRLGEYTHPIVLVNTNGFYDPLENFMRHTIAERFMNERHQEMWNTVSSPAEVLTALTEATPWSAAARSFAAVRNEDSPGQSISGP